MKWRKKDYSKDIPNGIEMAIGILIAIASLAGISILFFSTIEFILTLIKT